MLLPHLAPKPLGILFVILGIIGLIYMLNSGVLHQFRASAPSLGDLFFYVVLPVIAYIALCVAGLSLWIKTSPALSVSAGVMILLLIIGLRNSWDLVTSIARHDVTDDADPHELPDKS
jgi:hypothetical protein